MSTGAVAIFCPEQLHFHASVYAELVRRATPAWGLPEAGEPVTWARVIATYLSGPHGKQDAAHKMTAIAGAGWTVEAFHELAGCFEPDDERYCQRCEGVMDVALGACPSAWRKCPTCGPAHPGDPLF